MSQDIELKPIAWKVFETLRGSIELSKSVQITVALLVVKFLSDMRRVKKDKPASKSWLGAWSEMNIPADCDWDKLLTVNDPATHLELIFRSIEKSNSTLDGAFRNINFDNLRDSPGHSAMLHAIALISTIDLHPSSFSFRKIGNSFDALLQDFSEILGASAGSFYVPPELSALLAGILEPQNDEVILDPACGAGLLLTRLASQTDTRVVGQDWRTSELSLCKMNLLLHGLNNSRVQLSNPLLAPLLGDDDKILQADIVVSNPPFGMRQQSGDSAWSDRVDILRYDVSPRGPADYAFIAHMLEAARESTGRVAVITSLGALSRNDGGRFRRFVVENNLLAGVISLPPNLFHTTRVPVAILFFKKNKPTRDVIFVDGSRCFTSDGSLNRLNDQGASRIVTAVRKLRTYREFSRRVSQEEIRQNDYRLSVPLYVSPASYEPDVASLNTVARNILRIEKELTVARVDIEEILTDVGIKFD